MVRAKGYSFPRTLKERVLNIAIAEGHGDLVSIQKQTLEKIDKLADKIDRISNKVVVLEMK